LPDKEPDYPELVSLAEEFRKLLAVVDKLGLRLVGIHLCNAIEALQHESQHRDQAAGSDRHGGSSQ
jgi:hypothetical protein